MRAWYHEEYGYNPTNLKYQHLDIKISEPMKHEHRIYSKPDTLTPVNQGCCQP